MTYTTIFGKIINKEIPAHIIYEDDHTIAFLDNQPNMDGHTLVVPKIEYSNIFDIPEDVLAHVMTAVKKVAKILEDKLDCKGVNIVNNSGEVAGQEVMHIHFHVRPRFKGDGLSSAEGFHHNKDKNVTRSLEEVHTLLTK